jgi:bifunctional non-homologous end joining protein LigD
MPAKPASSSAPTVAGIRISHPDRPIYPDQAISKIQLAQYYESIGDWIVPHVKGRPLTLVHCPAGVAGPCVYLKHAKQWGPNALRRVRIQEKTKVGEYLVADSIEAMVSLAQMGIVEVHTWNSTDDDVERPNRIVWDLDPGPEVAWRAVVAAATVVRGVLQALDLTTTFVKAGRERKVLIDYLRNNRTNTSVCAFSPRARPGAMVSMPLDWRALQRGPQRWTLLTAPQRLKRLKTDPWAGYWAATQRLSNESIRAIARL